MQQQYIHSNPLVSIIVRTKDRPDLLNRALKSLANMDYQNKEIVIVNDGGCDVNKENISAILKDTKFEIFVNKTTLGRAEALNKGIVNSKGDLICFLDDDDVIEPQGTSHLVKAFDGVYNKIIYGNVICRRYEEDTCNLINEWVLDNPFDKELLVLENYIPINSLCIPKSLLLQIGPLDQSFLIYEDWDMLLRLSDIADFVHIDKLIAEYSIFGTSTITGKEGLEFQKHYRQKILSKHFHRVSPSMILKYIFFAPHVISKDREIDQLIDSIKGLNNKLAHTKKEIQFYQDKLNFYEDQLNFYKNLNEKINRLEKEKSELITKIEELNRENLKQIETIDKITKEKYYLVNEINTLTHSRSWRLTKPFRKMMQRLRKAFGLNKIRVNSNKDIVSLDSHICHEIVDAKKEKVEIIIVNYNGLKHLKRCIPSVLNTNYPFFSVTVVDNNSSDGSVDYLKNFFPQVKVIINSSNLGFGLANDIAIKQSDANLIALLNNDTEVEPNWLTYLVAYLMYDESIAATSSKLLLMNHPSVINNGGSAMSYLGFGYDKGLYLPDGKGFSEPKEILFPSGASCVMRKDVYLKVGGFDTSFFMYHEDVDLGWRFWIFGYKVIFVPQSRVYHAYGGTSHKIGGYSFREIYGLQHAMRSLIKNYQLPTLIKTLPLFLLLCIKKYPSDFFKVVIWNLKVLPSTIKERKKINKNRQNSDDVFFQSGLID
ncbi:MAG: glycosyltransferase, partial [Thermodesulfovibrionales bacterium]|nr:glycosyltransferase [Thermodesulfovibrionales bacterium]